MNRWVMPGSSTCNPTRRNPATKELDKKRIEGEYTPAVGKGSNGAPGPRDSPGKQNLRESPRFVAGPTLQHGCTNSWVASPPEPVVVGSISIVQPGCTNQPEIAKRRSLRVELLLKAS